MTEQMQINARIDRNLASEVYGQVFGFETV